MKYRILALATGALIVVGGSGSLAAMTERACLEQADRSYILAIANCNRKRRSRSRRRCRSAARVLLLKSKQDCSRFRGPVLPQSYTPGKYHRCDGNCTNGQGTARWNDGRVIYSGWWKNGKYHGRGTSYFPNKRVEYRGYFWKSKPDGYCVSYAKDGNIIYRGGWRYGQYHGSGRLYNSGRLQRRGIWWLGEYKGSRRGKR